MSKNSLVVYEGAMCCSSGVCGPEPDKELIEFNETLKKIKLEFKDIEITRASISFNANMFLENKEISQIIKEEGQKILPITCINNRIIMKQKYLKYEQLKEELQKYASVEGEI
ncbi:MAG: arsenite efflux transporter metallochaperone ArsD [Actinomycetota bacterium]